jgi:hypothetical protein
MGYNSNAIIDLTYFQQLWTGTAVDPDRLEYIVNAVSTVFDRFCNRPLKERIYTYVSGTDDDFDEGVEYEYIPEYTIFDAPKDNVFWFPTYPVSEIYEFLISDIEITSSTDYTADSGFILYSDKGKLIYNDGFDYNYLQNIKVKWKGGYASTSIEMSQLQYLCFLTIKDILNAPNNMTFKSEKIMQYSYTTIDPSFLKELQGLSPRVFSDLSKYRREPTG